MAKLGGLFGKSLKGIGGRTRAEIEAAERAAAQASWDRDNSAFAGSRRPEARGMTPTRMGVPSAEKFSLDDPKFGGGAPLAVKPQGVGAIMGKLLASPEARLENAASAKVSRMPWRDYEMDVYEFPSGANVRFHPAPDGTIEIGMSASKVGPDSPASLKAQVFADAMSAVERHARETGAAQKGASYLFSGETDAITRMFRAMGERAQMPGGAVMHDSPGGFEISFDPSRKPFEGRSAMGLFDSEAGYGLGFNRDMKPSEIINARAKQLGGPMVGGTPEALARAREQGFDVDTPLYHGTNKDFASFDMSKVGARLPSDFGPGIYTTPDPKSASTYAEGLHYYTSGRDPRGDGEGAAVMPLFARLQNPLRTKSRADGMAPQGERLGAWARFRGKDGIEVRGPNGDIEEVVVFDPKNIRSRFAAFDPTKRDSSDLLASALLGTTAAGGATALGGGEAEAAPKFPGSMRGVSKWGMENIRPWYADNVQERFPSGGVPYDMSANFKSNDSLAQPNVRMTFDGHYAGKPTTDMQYQGRMARQSWSPSKQDAKKALEIFPRLGAATMGYVDKYAPESLQFSGATTAHDKLYGAMLRGLEMPDYMPIESYTAGRSFSSTSGGPDFPAGGFGDRPLFSLIRRDKLGDLPEIEYNFRSGYDAPDGYKTITRSSPLREGDGELSSGMDVGMRREQARQERAQALADFRARYASRLAPATAGAAGVFGASGGFDEAEAKPYTPKLAALSKAGNAGWAGEALPSPIMAGKQALQGDKNLAMAEAGVLASSPAAFSLGYYMLNDPTMQGNVAMDRAEQEWADEASKRTQQLREDYFKPYDPWEEAAKQQTFNEKLTPSEQFNSWISPFFEAAASNVPDNALNPWQGESRKQLTGQDVQRTQSAMGESAEAFPLWAQSRAQQPIDLLGDALEMADPTWFGVSAARDWVDKRKKKGIFH